MPEEKSESVAIRCKHCHSTNDVKPTISGPQCAGCRSIGEATRAAYRAGGSEAVDGLIEVIGKVLEDRDA